MFKRIKTYLSLSLMITILGSLGCKKNTFNINDVNPNVPSDVSPKFILSGGLYNTAALMRGGNLGGADYAELYMGYWSVSGDYIPVTTTLTYQTTTDYYSGNWNQGFLNCKNYRQMELLGASDPNAGYYIAMAKIMEAFEFDRLVDQYNDIPYTQALQGGTLNFPAYDKASDVYNSLINSLDTAIIIINTAPSTVELPGNYDVMFQGNMSEWVQFANTIKLKMALNLTNYTGGSAIITSALSGLTASTDPTVSSFLAIGVDAAINPGYSNSSYYQQSPFYNDMGFSTSGAVQNNESYYRACDYNVNFMYNTSDTLRLYQLFAPNVQSPAVVLGRPFGSNVSVNQDNEHISAMGPGLLQLPTSPAVILSASESLFMQAEATLDGYLPGGAAAAGVLYQAAVEESFRLLQVGGTGYAAVADAFLAGSTNPLVNWGSSTNQLQTIITQEWVASSGFDPLNSWNNWRRLGIPTNLPVSQFSGNVATHIPYRLLYPTSEYSYNSTNVAKEGTINNLTSKIFWMP